jgi:hypothetical protein
MLLLAEKTPGGEKRELLAMQGHELAVGGGADAKKAWHPTDAQPVSLSDITQRKVNHEVRLSHVCSQGSRVCGVHKSSACHALAGEHSAHRPTPLPQRALMQYPCRF